MSIRNSSARRPKFFIIDGTATFPLILIMVYPRMSTLYVLLCFCALLVFLDYKGMKLPALFRFMRTMIVGNNRVIRPLTRNKIN